MRLLKIVGIPYLHANLVVPQVMDEMDKHVGTYSIQKQDVVVKDVKNYILTDI